MIKLQKQIKAILRTTLRTHLSSTKYTVFVFKKITAIYGQCRIKMYN